MDALLFILRAYKISRRVTIRAAPLLLVYMGESVVPVKVRVDDFKLKAMKKE